MDPRDLARGNGVSLSLGPVYMIMPGTNWGISSGPSFVVTLDPQLNVQSSNENAVKSAMALMERGVRRRLMNGLANEFAVMHDDLLYELAR